MLKKMIIVSLLSGLLFAVNDANDTKEGEKIYMAKGCYGCHGTEAEGVNNYPRLACRSEADLLDKLHKLRRGIGHTDERDMMIPFAKALSEAQIKAVVKYLSRKCQESKEEEEFPEELLGGNNGD